MTDMEEILEFETKLANVRTLRILQILGTRNSRIVERLSLLQISTPQEYRRNFTAIYSKTTVADMEKAVPQVRV